jgi:hypothetical protein
MAETVGAGAHQLQEPVMADAGCGTEPVMRHIAETNTGQ